jgi:AcrR family transcriptional regulator
MSGPGRSTTRRGRPRDPGADAAILRAALEVFAEGGVEGASIEQIAKRAGVARLTVYRRWSSKEALIAQAIETAREGVPDPSSLQDDDAPLAQLIERMVEESVEPLADPRLRALTARLVGSGASHPSLLETYWEHHVVPRRRRSRAVLERAKREGMLAEDADVEVVIDAMVGAIMYRLLVRPGRPNAGEIRRYVRAVIRQAGLRLP